MGMHGTGVDMTRKPASKFEGGDAQIVVSESANKRKPALHFGVICGDDAATFILKPEVGQLLQRALEAISDGHRRRH